MSMELCYSGSGDEPTPMLRGFDERMVVLDP